MSCEARAHYRAAATACLREHVSAGFHICKEAQASALRALRGLRFNERPQIIDREPEAVVRALKPG